MSCDNNETSFDSGSVTIPSLLAAADHVYRDYSILPCPDFFDIISSDCATGSRGTTQTFPRKLHYLLTSAETSLDGLKSIVSWQPHGRCFVVHDSKGFVAHVLPNWFMQSKLASFQRQLNLYGFKRFTIGTDKGGYYHERFLRGRPDLVLHIRRTKVKGAGHRKAAIPDSEPNFYRQFPLLTQMEKAAPSLSPASVTIPVVSGGDVGPFKPAPPLYLQESKSPSHMQESKSLPQLQESTPFINLPESTPNPQLPNVPQIGLQQEHQQQWSEALFVQSAAIPTMTATMATLGVQVGSITRDGGPITDVHFHDFNSSDTSTSSSISQSSGHSTGLPEDSKRQEFAPSISKPTDLDPSLLLMGEQQGLFSVFLDRTPSSPRSLASALCYQSYQNHDIIVDALRAVAPFYPAV